VNISKSKTKSKKLAKEELNKPVESSDVNDIVAKIITDDSATGQPEVPVVNKAQDAVTAIKSGSASGTGPAEEVDPEFLNDFLVETKEHIENIEMSVLALETDPTNAELINSLFRSFHTIKGLAGFVNQDLVRKIAHQTETQLDKCRKGESTVSKSFVDLILTSSDLLKKICENLDLNKEPDFLKVVDLHLEHLNNGSVSSNAAWENGGNSEYQAIKVDKIGEIMVGQGLDPKTVDELLAKQEEHPELKLGQLAVKRKRPVFKMFYNLCEFRRKPQVY
jgi:two-component system chemotaxis sensor kinase CheA